MSAKDVIKTYEQAMSSVLDALDEMTGQVTKAQTAKDLTDRCRDAQYELGERRTDALVALRDDGWSLAELKAEFGISRSRLSAMMNRDVMRETKRAERRKRAR